MTPDFPEIFADCYVLIKPSKGDDKKPKSRKTFECSADWFLRAMALLSVTTRTCEKCAKPRSEFATQTQTVAKVAAPTQTETMAGRSIAVMTEQTKTDRSISAVVASSCKETQTKVPVAVLTKPEALIDCRAMAVKSKLPKKHRQSLIPPTKTQELCCKGTQTKPVSINAKLSSSKLEAQNGCRAKPQRKNAKTQTERIKFRKTTNDITSSKSESNEKGVETLGAIGTPTHHVNHNPSKDKPGFVDNSFTATVKRSEKEPTPKVGLKTEKRTGAVESVMKVDATHRMRKSLLGAAPNDQVNQRERKDAITKYFSTKKSETGRINAGSSSNVQTSQQERKDGIKQFSEERNNQRERKDAVKQYLDGQTNKRERKDGIKHSSEGQINQREQKDEIRHSSDNKQHQPTEPNQASSNGNSCKARSKENDSTSNAKPNKLEQKKVLENTSSANLNQSSKAAQNPDKLREALGYIPKIHRIQHVPKKAIQNTSNVERITRERQDSTDNTSKVKQHQPGHNKAIKNISNVERNAQEQKNSIDSNPKDKQNQPGHNVKVKNPSHTEERKDSRSPKRNRPCYNQEITQAINVDKNSKEHKDFSDKAPKQPLQGHTNENKQAINVEKTSTGCKDWSDKTPKQHQQVHNKATKTALSPSKNERFNSQVVGNALVSDAALSQSLQSVDRFIRHLEVEQIIGCHRSQLPGSNPLRYVYAYAELLRLLVLRSLGNKECLKELIKKGLWHVQRLLEDFNIFPPEEVIRFDQQVIRLVRSDGLWSFMGARRIVQDQHQNSNLVPPVEEPRSVADYSSVFEKESPIVQRASSKEEILQAVGSLIPVIKSIKRSHPENGNCEDEVKIKRRREKL